MNYDEKIAKAEQIIAQLEQSEALSMEEYRRLADEATTLLRQCKETLVQTEEQWRNGDSHQ
ncbi:MAG: exodeoxyribonuclease VII small subunit [Paludibacteraceae bacterium]|jgi:exodeoxyribonuclease VII small subunit|nr:exodeoxyribonuclease VII small subunit [Paludibacteraceae bacterium]